MQYFLFPPAILLTMFEMYSINALIKAIICRLKISTTIFAMYSINALTEEITCRLTPSSFSNIMCILLFILLVNFPPLFRFIRTLFSNITYAVHSILRRSVFFHSCLSTFVYLFCVVSSKFKLLMSIVSIV